MGAAQEVTKYKYETQPTVNHTTHIMYTLVVLCALVAAASAGALYHAPLAYAAPYIGGTQYKAQDILGQYNYGYATGNGISKSEVRGADGRVAGGYSYVAPDGQVIETRYTAGPEGFRAVGNAIPVAPPLPHANVVAINEHLAAKAAIAPVAAVAPVAAYAHPLAYHGLAYKHHL